MSDCTIHVHDDGLPASLAREVARLHTAAIDGGFLSTLGQPFLASLYQGLAQGRSSFLITATRGDDLLGFICGATQTRRAYLEFLLSRRAVGAALRLLPRLWSPRVVRRVSETLLYPTRRTEVSLPPAEILNFCVQHSARGQGIGRRLFEALVAEFARRRVHEIRIVTGAEQKSAQAFYDRVGAHRVTDLEIHEGTRSVAYTYALPQPGAHHVRPTTEIT